MALDKGYVRSMMGKKNIGAERRAKASAFNDRRPSALAPGWSGTPQGGYTTPQGRTWNPTQGPALERQKGLGVGAVGMNTAQSTPSVMGQIFKRRLLQKLGGTQRVSKQPMQRM